MSFCASYLLCAPIDVNIIHVVEEAFGVGPDVDFDDEAGCVLKQSRLLKHIMTVLTLVVECLVQRGVRLALDNVDTDSMWLVFVSRLMEHCFTRGVMARPLWVAYRLVALCMVRSMRMVTVNQFGVDKMRL